ncbi:MAG: ScyD/ScyE family protein [Pseudomonadota bacterium]|nr:ScyD/ScyE family protein [Pseudomonadota bacterium]
MKTAFATRLAPRRIASGITALLLLTGSTPLFAQSPPAQSVFVSGLTGPTKADTTYLGGLLVSERGTGMNDGRLTVVDRSGIAHAIVGGLPSGIDATNGVSGAQGVVVRGCCVVELAIGEGDTLRFDGPPRQVPNATGANSPLFSTVLRFTFNRTVHNVSDAFELTPADHANLADGYSVEKTNSAGDWVKVRVLGDTKDFRPDPVTNVRGSNPFGIAENRSDNGLLLADAGQNSIVAIGSWSGPPRTVVRFAPIRNAPGVVPPVSDPVPTAIRHYQGSKYLVSLLTGVPFVPGNASIRVVDIDKRNVRTLITGLTSVTDVLPIGSAIYVLEISSNLSQGAPGRLLRFASPTAKPEVVASGLLGASGMTYSAALRSIFITESFAGRITRVPL